MADRRWWSRVASRNATRWAGGFIVAVCLVALFARALAPYDPARQLDIIALKNAPPTRAHPFGTDVFSRDVLSRVMFGARISLSVAALSVLLATTIGASYGMIAGYVGGRVDAAMMHVLDALLSIPRVLLLLAVLALWQPVGLPGLILLIGLTGWYGTSRLVRAEVRANRGRDYVVSARALGASHLRIVLRHLLPNIAGPIIVAATLGVGNVIVLEAGLSFLGVGAREPNASWGTIFLSGSSAPTDTWWVSVFPGLAIVGTVLAFNVLGDALRDVLDPRQLPRTGAPSPESTTTTQARTG
jgi:peptide/nickel transport system permease protein